MNLNSLAGFLRAALRLKFHCMSRGRLLCAQTLKTFMVENIPISPSRRAFNSDGYKENFPFLFPIPTQQHQIEVTDMSFPI